MLHMVYYGSPLLRKKAEPVKEVGQEIIDLVAAMDEMMIKHRGVGLAAPQIGKSIRLFILRDEIEDEKGEIHAGPLQVFINPVLSHPSTHLVSMNEGCLSIPGIRAEVMRPSEITVEATNLEGNRFKMHCTGLLARIIMHENDHINGVLFIDRLSKKQRDLIEPRLRDLKKSRLHL